MASLSIQRLYKPDADRQLKSLTILLSANAQEVEDSVEMQPIDTIQADRYEKAPQCLAADRGAYMKEEGGPRYGGEPTLEKV